MYIIVLKHCTTSHHLTELGNEIGKFEKKKMRHVNFLCLLVINEKHMNSHFVLCQFENLCFESNALKMASISTHAFLKSGPETVHDPLHITGIAATSF